EYESALLMHKWIEKKLPLAVHELILKINVRSTRAGDCKFVLMKPAKKCNLENIIRVWNDNKNISGVKASIAKGKVKKNILDKYETECKTANCFICAPLRSSTRD